MFRTRVAVRFAVDVAEVPVLPREDWSMATRTEVIAALDRCGDFQALISVSAAVFRLHVRPDLLRLSGDGEGSFGHCGMFKRSTPSTTPLAGVGSTISPRHLQLPVAQAPRRARPARACAAKQEGPLVLGISARDNADLSHRLRIGFTAAVLTVSSHLSRQFELRSFRLLTWLHGHHRCGASNRTADAVEQAVPWFNRHRVTSDRRATAAGIA